MRHKCDTGSASRFVVVSEQPANCPGKYNPDHDPPNAIQCITSRETPVHTARRQVRMDKSGRDFSFYFTRIRLTYSTTTSENHRPFDYLQRWFMFQK